MIATSRLIGWLVLLGAQGARADWPEYRGPWANGSANAPGNKQAIGLPVQWSETNNVKWKASIPDRGWSTPVVMGQQIWLTTATEDGHDFFAICVDADSGKIRFTEKLFHADAPEPLGNKVNGYASPSPVSEPGRVYVHFGSYGTACLDTQTFKVIWKRSDLPCRHFRGPASSPIVFQDLLILTFDGIDLQYLVALDKHTGRTVWKTDRTADWNDLNADGRPIGDGDFRKGFGTPLIIRAENGTQMLSVGAKAIYSYDPASGHELWKFKTSAHSPAPRPLFGRGLAFLAAGRGKSEWLALRVNRRGELTEADVAWRTTRNVPQSPSPVLVDDLLFSLSDSGVVCCLEAATGKEIWQERVGGEYYASLLYGDGNLYCCNQDGKTCVLKAGRTFEVRGTNTLDDGFMASPAVAGKALILRTKKNLYRIETDTSKAAMGRSPRSPVAVGGERN